MSPNPYEFLNMALNIKQSIAQHFMGKKIRNCKCIVLFNDL